MAEYRFNIVLSQRSGKPYKRGNLIDKVVKAINYAFPNMVIKIQPIGNIKPKNEISFT